MEQIHLRPYVKLMELVDVYERTGMLVHVDGTKRESESAIQDRDDLNLFVDENPVGGLIASAIHELQSFHRHFTSNNRIVVNENMIHRFFCYWFDDETPGTRLFGWLLALRNPAATAEDVAAAEQALPNRNAARRMRRRLPYYIPTEIALFPSYRTALAREAVPALKVPFTPTNIERLAVHAVFEFLYHTYASTIDPQLLRASVVAQNNANLLMTEQIETFVGYVGVNALNHIVDQANDREEWHLDTMLGHFESRLPREQAAEYSGLTTAAMQAFCKAVSERTAEVVHLLAALTAQRPDP